VARPMCAEAGALAQGGLAPHSRFASRNRPCVPPLRCADTTGERFQSVQAPLQRLSNGEESLEDRNLITPLLGWWRLRRSGSSARPISSARLSSARRARRDRVRAHLLAVRLPAHGTVALIAQAPGAGDEAEQRAASGTGRTAGSRRMERYMPALTLRVRCRQIAKFRSVSAGRPRGFRLGRRRPRIGRLPGLSSRQDGSRRRACSCSGGRPPAPLLCQDGSRLACWRSAGCPLVGWRSGDCLLAC